MKKTCFLSLLLLGMLCLHACGSAAEDIPLDAMQNAKTKTTICLGMPREAVEALLGAGRSAFGAELDRDPAEPSVFFYGADGDADTVTVAYWKGYTYYIGLTWNPEELTSSNWQMKYGLTKGSRAEELLLQLGEGEKAALDTSDFVPMNSLIYRFDQDWRPADDGAVHAYQIEFVLDGETDKVRSFYICDWEIVQRAG